MKLSRSLCGVSSRFVKVARQYSRSSVGFQSFRSKSSMAAAAHANENGPAVEYRLATGEFAAQVPDVIEPAWWTGTPALDPATFTIDCSNRDMQAADLSPQGELAQLVRETFDRVGLVLVTNTGLTDPQEMRKLSKMVLEEEMKYEGGANPRANLAPDVYEVGAPLTAHLHYHHEMAYVGESTRNISFMCVESLPDRGASYVSDSVAATEYFLTTELGKKLADLGVCYHRNLTDREAFKDKVEEGVYNHWQMSLGTEDPEEAARRAEAKQLQVSWGPDRLLKTKYFTSAFEYFPQMDKNLLYCSVADHGMWFDKWPLVQHLPYSERPLTLTFGDESEFTREELLEFVAVYDKFGIKLDWRKGDVAVICNYRFAHGRPGITLKEGEDRKLGVVLGQTYSRVGDIPGKW